MLIGDSLVGNMLRTLFWTSLILSFILSVVYVLNQEVRLYGRVVDSSGEDLDSQLIAIVLVGRQEVYRGSLRWYASGHYQLQLPNSFGYRVSFPEERPSVNWGTAVIGNLLQLYPPSSERIYIALFEQGSEPDCYVSLGSGEIVQCYSGPQLRLSGLPFPRSVTVSILLTLMTLAVLGAFTAMKNTDPQQGRRRRKPRSFDPVLLPVAVVSIGLLIIIIVGILTWSAVQVSLAVAALIFFFAIPLVILATVAVLLLLDLIDGDQAIATFHKIGDRILGRDFIDALVRIIYPYVFSGRVESGKSESSSTHSNDEDGAN